MKKILFSLVLLLTLSMSAQKPTLKEAWLEKWENSKNYLIAIAEAMPEEKYDYKPTERQMSFKEQLVHIKGNMDWLSNSYFTENGFERTKAPLPESKEITIQFITDAFNSTKKIIENTPESDLKNTVTFFAGPKSKIQILNLLQDHVTHHRGQLIVYLNLNEIEPPSFVGW